MKETQRAYIVYCSGSTVGTDSHELLICRPSELGDCLNDAAWNHHNEWYSADDWGDDDDSGESECHSSASALEYTPATMDKLDCRRSGGGSFLEEHGVLEAWQALGYEKPPFEGSEWWSVRGYIKDFKIPICQVGVSWQEVEQWGKQRAACQDVLRVLDSLRQSIVPHLPPLLDTQLKGAYAMAENEIKIIEANVQKVIARLKAL